MPENEKSQKEMIERIYDELVGDKFTEGIIPKVKRLEKTVDKHDVALKIISGVIILITSLVTFWKDLILLFKEL